MLRLLCVALAIVAALAAGCAASQPATIRVLTYNIHHGEGLDGQIDLERIARVIRGTEADLVALQEVDRGVERSGRGDQPARLAELTGLHAVFGRNIDLQGGEYGNAVLSRLPIEHWENHSLPRFQQGEQRGVLEVHVRAGGRKLVFFATHFDHRRDDGERLASVAVLRELAQQWSGEPIIVAGDLNATPDSRVLADARTFLLDAFAGDPETGLTFSADQPNRRIDYVLSSQHPGLRSTDCRVIPDPIASDHRPVLATFETAGE